MTEQGCQDVDEAKDRAEDLLLFEGLLEEYAYDLAVECFFTKYTPATLRNYYDHRAFARDLELCGDARTFDLSGSA